MARDATLPPGGKKTGKTHDDEKADLLYGVQAIADHLGLRTRQAQHQIDKRGFPVFRMGGIVCARKTSIAAWIAEQEASARGSTN
jgi:hypothetical protein